MKKIYMILAAMTLLSMSLNAQIDATKKVAQTQQTAPTGKKVDTQLGVAKMALNPTHRAPARATETNTYSYTFSSNPFNSATQTVNLNDVNWTSTINWGSTTTPYYGYDNNSVQIGARNRAARSWSLSTSEIPGTITSIQVAAGAYSANATIGVTVGGQVFGSSQSLSSTVSTKSFTGSASGQIVITLTNPNTGGRYFYLRSISVTYETESGVETSDLTVCDGQYYAQYLPVHGYYHDEAQHNQMIYPASMLASMVGKTIKSMTFYPTSGSVTWSGGETESASGINFRNGSVRFKLACISSGSSFDADNPSFVNATLTEVKTVNMPSTANTSATTWLIRFDQDFVYTGGDLLIDVTNPTTGNWGLTFFTVDDTGDNYYGYLTSGAGNAALNYLPKVTFTYEGEPNPIHDLSIALSAPATAGAGTTVDVTATVTNNGDFAENGYTVTVSDGTNIVNITAQEELGIGETATFTVQFATSANAAGSTVNYTATVACTDDAVAANNSATASTSLLNLPPPINVAATAGNNHNATMTWEPPVDPLPVTESFENGANGWTFIDNDGDGYNWTWSNTLSANTGTGLVYSESYHNNESGSGGVALSPDNWLISPEAILNGTFSLYAKGQDANYPAEVFGVYVCVGDYNPNDLSNFQQVGSDITTTSSMTQYTYDLSSFNGQIGHIAIVHHEVTDQFILDIDDITFLAPPQPVSYNIYLDGVLVGNVPSSTNPLSYDFSNLADGNHTCAVSAVYDLGESVAVPATFTITSLPTPNAPTVTPTTGDANVTISITPDPATDGNLVYYVEYNGQQTQDLTFPRSASDYVVYVHAHTTATANYNESPEAVVPVTIPALPQTTAPSISYETVGDNVVITATGNGTVTLTIPGYPEASGTGSVSITVPRHMQDYTVTATATAQEADHLASNPTTQEVPIPGLASEGGWMLMEGTYTNGSDQLSFTRRNANNDVEPILFVDQFTDLTRHNDHPDHYNYHLSEVVETNARTSSTVPVPVYKTYSKLDGLFTKDEVDNDDYADVENRLPGNAVNGKMSYDIKTDADMYYYGLFRGGLTEEHPVINESHRFSMLQQSDEQDTYFFSEAYSNNVLPKYQHIGSSDVERIDKEYVIGDLGGNNPAQMNTNTVTYVPVIWTWGQNTGRIDGINNSYGSDIKISELGNLNITIGGARTNDKPTGRWTYEGEEYCVYAPVISIDGFVPQIVTAEDGDTYVYEPYMYRVWCTYERARNFGHNNGPGGHKELIDAGERKAPFLIGEVKVAELPADSSATHVFIGSLLDHGTAQTQSSFGVPVTENPENVEFIVRFYYKKTVTDAAPSTSGMRGNRDGGSEGYGMAERGGNGGGIPTGISELTNIAYVVSKTYVNAQGMQSDKPFDGLNIVVTRFSDGTTTTTKVVR